jgi:hypothetical protein
MSYTLGCRRAIAVRALLAAALVALIMQAAATPVALAQAQFYVNTTEDPPSANEHCLPGSPCPLRGAIEKAESLPGGAIITACFDPAVVENARPCPPGRQPLTADDPGFDAETGKWAMRFAPEAPPFVFSAGGTQIDFRGAIEGWASPADNRFVVDGTGGRRQFAFRMESSGNMLAGFDLSGEFDDSAVLLQGDFFGGQVSNNQIGPGLAFRAIANGNGVKVRSDQSLSNRIIGNWCGLAADGTTLQDVAEDCIYILEGARSNTVGGETEADRNILSASRLGVGVKIEGDGTDDNAVLGNWIGLDATGEGREALTSGVLVVNGASRTRIAGNVIGSSTGAGIALFARVLETVIEDNRLGAAPEGDGCRSNRTYGLTLNDGPSSSTIRRNLVRCNRGGGILLQGAGSRDNVLSENLITENDGDPIDFSRGPNGDLAAPRLTRATRNSLTGAGCAGCRIEIFSDPAGEAAVFEGVVTANAADGSFVFEHAAGFEFDTVTATQTEGLNTSALSRFTSISGGGSTPVPGTPTPAPTAGPSPTGLLFSASVYMPLALDTASLR